jgi:YYY domain-containing protein
MIQYLLIWWLVIQAFALAGLPLSRFIFRNLPDQGYAFAKSLGLLVVGYLAWLLGMLGLAPFNAGFLIFCGLVVGIGGWWLTREKQPQAAPFVQRLQQWFAEHWRMVLGYEAVFLIALAFLAWLRSYNPDPWGTERPMDFAFFNAIQVSNSLPPHDPWLAGFSINYYYFGYLLMAAVALVSNLDPAVAFNLSLALVFALTALNIAGIINNLIALTLRQRSSETNANNRNWWRIPAVIIGIVMVLISGNQAGTLEIVTGSEVSVALKGQQLQQAISNGLGARETITLDPPITANGWDFDNTASITPKDMRADFNWWWPSRVVWDDYRDVNNPDAPPYRRYTITEFPFFSFWLGDMHPHVMALPFGLLAFALALATIARRNSEQRVAWLELGVSGIIIGSLYTINSWDFPTYLLLMIGALLLAHIYRQRENPEQNYLQWAWWKPYLVQAGQLIIASFALFIPFYITIKSLVGSKDPLINIPLLSNLSRTVGLVTSTRTALFSFVLIFGMFLVPLLGFVAGQFLRGRQLPQSALRTNITGAAIASVLLFVVGFFLGFPLLALLPLAILAILLAILHVEETAQSTVLWGFALVCLICFGTEIIYIRDVFEGASARMNTLFKFYYQAWLLWGLLAGYAVWWLLDQVGRNYHKLAKIASPLVLLVFIAFFASSLNYPWYTAGKMWQDATPRGLDGKTPREGSPEGAAALAWIRENTSGRAVILEAVGGSYSFEGHANISAATGRQTVLGWPGHENQWRGGDPIANEQIGKRTADVKQIYTSHDTDQVRDLLNSYNVDYVFVGPLELNQMGETGNNGDTFAQLGSVVFQQGNITIYQISR